MQLVGAPKASHRFAHVLDGLSRPHHHTNWWDQILHETTHFVVIPTLGAIVPNWVLAVPKRPLANLSCLTNEERSDLALVIERVEQVFGDSNLYMFEHGDVDGGPHACGVDQGHLHLATLSFDLVALAAEARRSLHWAETYLKIPPVQSDVGSPYLYVHGQGRSVISYPAHAQSQWFRRLIAKEARMPEAWDYRTNP